MDHSLIIWILCIIPLTGLAICQLPMKPRALLQSTFVTAVAETVASFFALGFVIKSQTVFVAHKLFFLDMLSVYHLVLVSIIFSIASLYAIGYFKEKIDHSVFDKHTARRYVTLWSTFLFTMVLVLVSNNMGILWVALEATTLASAFLILTKEEPASIEAMWKYLLVCSVGIAFALIGTMLLAAASRQAFTDGSESLLWTDLREAASRFDPKLMLAAFVFAVVGFGTKAGLAPMHTWLPDAHSQAPTPVSAVFSGVMLNSALYCVLRYLPITENALGHNGHAQAILLFFGLLSIAVPVVFIPSQRDIKRLLAYSSVEHIGIITVGIALGGAGTIAALFHTVNHSFSKTLAFMSAGSLSQRYGTRDMRLIKGALRTVPLWGTGFFIALLSLIGAAPFAIFMSELQILKAAMDTGRYAVVALFLIGTIAVFITILRHAFNVTLGSKNESIVGKFSFANICIVVGIVLLLITLGLWVPSPFWSIICKAAAIIG